MKQVHSINDVRLHSLSLIRDALKSTDTSTKNSVARMTGLSVATCNTLLNEMAASGEITEVQTGVPSMGRPPEELSLQSRLRLHTLPFCKP